MGLDTFIYKGWKDEVDSYYDINTKQLTVIPRQGIETNRFRKNYVFMEWLEKHLGFEMRDQEYYILYKDDVKALLEDCELVIDLVEDANRNTICYEFSDELREQIIKIFPQNNWNKEDFSHWEKDASAPTLVPHYFGLRDFEDVKQIRDTFENIITEYVDKVIIQNSW
jgi:hypothetical protein